MRIDPAKILSLLMMQNMGGDSGQGQQSGIGGSDLGQSSPMGSSLNQLLQSSDMGSQGQSSSLQGKIEQDLSVLLMLQSLEGDSGQGQQSGVGNSNFGQSAQMSSPLDQLVQSLDSGNQGFMQDGGQGSSLQNKIEQELSVLLMLQSLEGDSGQGQQSGVGNSNFGQNAQMSSPLDQLVQSLDSGNQGSSQGPQDGGLGSSLMSRIDQDLALLLMLQSLESGSGQGQQSGAGGPGSDPSGAAGGAPTGDTGAPSSPSDPTPPGGPAGPPAPGASPQQSPANTPPSQVSGTGNPTGAQVVNIDGGNASGHGVKEQIDNNTGSEATYSFDNSQGQIVGKLDLPSGGKGDFEVNADGPDAKSARIVKDNPDGSIPVQSNLDELNSKLNAAGKPETAADASLITAGGDKLKIDITAEDGQKAGNDEPGGAYTYPTEDQIKDPKNNPMTIGMNNSTFFDNNFHY